MITIGKTTYTVEKATEADDTFYLTGPRGALSIAVPFSNNADKYHAFRFSGSHSDLKENGQLWTTSRDALEAAAA